MLHDLAFVVIGLVIGFVVGRSSKRVWIPVILGLIGSFVGGRLFIHHRYLSLVTAVIGAVILGYIGQALGGRRRTT
jgi:uncharacterized membrane protein YeaQ/YmgE (transglycosylase-associated protein family)